MPAAANTKLVFLLILLLLSLAIAKEPTNAKSREPKSKGEADVDDKGTATLQRKISKLTKQNKQLQLQIRMISKLRQANQRDFGIYPSDNQIPFSDNVGYNMLWLVGAFLGMIVAFALFNKFAGLFIPVALYYILFDYYQYEKWKLYAIVVFSSPLMAFVLLGVVAVIGLTVAIFTKRQ